MKFYHVDKLDFWSVYCWLAPVFMIVLGVYTFLVCIFGFVISGSENRPMIAGYAVLLTLAFLAQLASIFKNFLFPLWYKFFYEAVRKIRISAK